MHISEKYCKFAKNLANIFTYLRKNSIVYHMESVDNEILNSLKKRGRGVVFFAEEYSHYSNPKRVQKALEQLLAKGLVIRVARGIYCYPKKDKIWNTGYLPPSYDDIANAIAKKERSKIVPTGIHALNRLGLSDQLPMKFVYLTSGRTRTVTLSDGQTIQLVHTALKNLQFYSRTAMLITFALKEIGKDNLTNEQKKHVIQLLKEENANYLKHDLALMPAWIQTITLQAL